MGQPFVCLSASPLIVGISHLRQVLGTLNNLTALDLPKGIGWVDVLSNYALAPFLTKLLVPGMAQNDVILEVTDSSENGTTTAYRM